MKGSGCYFFRVICLICGICCCCVSCAKSERTCEMILNELMAITEELPAGQVYCAQAEEGSDRYLSATLFQSLYGEKSRSLFDALEDYALYLSSFAIPCEIAVLRAYSSNDADALAAMCLQRIENLRLVLRGTEFYEHSESAFVLCHGKYVVIMIGDDAAMIRNEALRLLRT